MISRRPNKCASREKAPGPRRKIATAIITIRKMARLLQKRFVVATGNQESAMLKLPQAISTLAIEVRRPVSRNAPLATAKKPIAHIHMDGRLLSAR
jgi:hypothetical protein